jgi:AAA+ superfamily predicted ATPase
MPTILLQLTADFSTAVLHGPPGTGKTLTAEGISELLKCPLYMASAGELGTDSRFLESELQKILDICHAWGAILLLDEADVFLEKRNMHDIHRNALVSIFLRQLEYFQGILFLTTNRVEVSTSQPRRKKGYPYADSCLVDL